MPAPPLRALISTIQPSSGGVPAKTRWLVQELAALGITSTLAWYEPWSCSPELSVPLPHLLSGRRPAARREPVWPEVPGEAIGAWLPELEFSHYWATRPWRRLIAAADLHLVTTGNPLCAYRYLRCGVPFLAWVGTPWHGDRVDRVRGFPWYRRLLDTTINAPVLRRMERQVLRAPQGRILTISQHTARELEAIGGRAPAGVLYLPPDSRWFHPAPDRRMPWRLGFSGRYSDPRKRITLLLEAVARLLRLGHPVQLHLSGERDGRFLQPLIERFGLQGRVICHPYLREEQLAQLLQSLDLFVIPSHQEGLCIAALEAMACGVPVVSTRCGGPEEFVIAGSTGELVAADAEAMAAAIRAICVNSEQRVRLGEGAFDWIRLNATQQVARARFRECLSNLYPDLDQVS
ncbi:MAG: glycosyltransferase family 4 protein [Cyanobacteria bacterium]|nr:glycosyltransferase family 4 protein [Cyanobacteriota bacterium]